MSINPDQAIFDAIAAATTHHHGSIFIDIKVFIEVFNGHRDRKLCTSIDSYEVTHLKAMLANEHQKTVPVEERNRIAQDPLVDGRTLYFKGGDAQAPSVAVRLNRECLENLNATDDGDPAGNLVNVLKCGFAAMGWAQPSLAADALIEVLLRDAAQTPKEKPEMTEEEIVKLLKSISVDPGNPPAEIGWFNHALTDEDIKVLSEYLAAKWGTDRKANLRQRLLNLIRDSTLSASMNPLTETLMRLDDPEADLDAIERDVRYCEEHDV